MVHPAVSAERPGGTRSEPYFSFPGYALQNRHNTIWRGDWVGNFPWLRRDGPFGHIPGGPLLDLGFARVIPHQVLTHQRSWEFRGRVHAGTAPPTAPTSQAGSAVLPVPFRHMRKVFAHAPSFENRLLETVSRKIARPDLATREPGIKIRQFRVLPIEVAG